MVRAPEGFGSRTYLSAGYVANAPDQLLGASMMTVGERWSGWGLYVDGKMTTNSPEERETFDSGRTATDVARQSPEDELYQEESTWKGLNGAIVRALNPQLAVYAGAGISRESAYDEYRSEEQRGTANAYYWVEDETDRSTGVNLLAGAIFRATEYVVFQFGAESNPRGGTVGVGVALPFD